MKVNEMQQGDNKDVEVNISFLPCPVQETKRDINPRAGAAEGAEET